jgi:hypothetical protein
MIVTILAVTAGIAVGVAYYKHHTTAAVIASAKKEVANIEALYAKAETVAKTDLSAVVTRLKALL